jgi:hypothetical protein
MPHYIMEFIEIILEQHDIAPALFIVPVTWVPLMIEVNCAHCRILRSGRRNRLLGVPSGKGFPQLAPPPTLRYYSNTCSTLRRSPMPNRISQAIHRPAGNK